jgi:Zn-finger nucleic acid-binding protein
MEEITLDTLKGDVTVDRCTKYKGIWFDIGEVDPLMEKWGPNSLLTTATLK